MKNSLNPDIRNSSQPNLDVMLTIGIFVWAGGLHLYNRVVRREIEHNAVLLEQHYNNLENHLIRLMQTEIPLPESGEELTRA
ncbi:MAG: hypothetical protein U5L76_02430 [Patescibacteria group bacterium]|nr:hypothetical protein [Patescibacteria group bacterium]